MSLRNGSRALPFTFVEVYCLYLTMYSLLDGARFFDVNNATFSAFVTFLIAVGSHGAGHQFVNGRKFHG